MPMKIKVLNDCLIGGKYTKAGEVVEVTERVGRELIALERAVPVREEAKAVEPVKPAKGAK